MDNKLQFEAIVHDVKYHNSKLGDDNWMDITVRVQGEAGIEAAMRLNRAKNKLVEISFEQE